MRIVFQTQNYMNVIIACVAIYSWVLDIGRELELIWARQGSIMFKVFYAMLRYGGLVISASVVPTTYATRKSPPFKSIRY